MLTYSHARVAPSHGARYTRAPSKDGHAGVSYGYPVAAIPGLHKHYAGPRAGLMHRPAGRPTLVGPGLHTRPYAPTADNARIVPIYAYIRKGRPFVAIPVVYRIFC